MHGPRALDSAIGLCYGIEPPAPRAQGHPHGGSQAARARHPTTMDDRSTTALDELILRAQKPSRYVGCEFGSIGKDLAQARVRFALAFPDTYEVGMSNLGFRLLYHALNDRDGVACERVFLPWPDMDAMLREARLPLFTLESRAPVR